MNKLEQKFHDKLLSRLSDHDTKANVSNAVEVCKDFSVSFSLFCAENYNLEKITNTEVVWRAKNSGRKYTNEQLFYKFIENEV